MRALGERRGNAAELFAQLVLRRVIRDADDAPCRGANREVVLSCHESRAHRGVQRLDAGTLVQVSLDDPDLIRRLRDRRPKSGRPCSFERTLRDGQRLAVMADLVFSFRVTDLRAQRGDRPARLGRRRLLDIRDQRDGVRALLDRRQPHRDVHRAIDRVATALHQRIDGRVHLVELGCQTVHAQVE